MAVPTARRGTPHGSEQSIGDLVSVATRDLSQLVRCELDLAKMELKSDIKKAAITAALGAVALFAVCLLLILLCFAFAFGLVALAVPGGIWGAFLFVALTVAVLIGLAVLVAFLLYRRMTKMKRTRKTLSDDTSLLQRVKSAAKVATKVN